MKKEAIQSFTARISQASKSELIVILYEMTLTEITEAREVYHAGDMAAFNKELKKAQKYVSELMAALDYRFTLSYDLLSLYLYINKRIITAIMKKNPLPLDSAEVVLKKLLIGFEGVSKADTSGPMMRNSQQLYAGLTYGKGKLNETYIDPDNRSRGFIA
ncbi:flagellar protein FliS [Mobilitalea sibirica]|uniref:Flagellar protein FliS n=1 Tax=Mobilitalea sibirica TaxID=1462919 RepID=A0A8J7H2I5_9FIRM|nr:flagellar export chaperone FliS [Mobilitalea sibirica]MBH1941009.1 flagellar protein FliS [Mobilitalea sibirica]